MDLLEDSSSCSSQEEEEEERVTAPQVTKKARKILSLAAVLPQKILEELTQRHVQGDPPESSSDDEDDDDDDDESLILKRKKKSVSKDGISSFLSDLNAIRPSAGSSKSLSSKTNSTTTTTTTTTTDLLGAAFLQTTTVVQKGTSVRNIHEEPLLTETKNHHEKTEDLTEPNFETKVKRLSSVRPIVQPAPSITSHPASSSSSSTTTDTPIQSSTTNPLHATDDSTETNRKRSRRELENALRKGDFQQLDDGTVTHLQQARPDSFVPDPETYAIPQHGIRVVPTAMYDPKAGTATNLASGKGRGKNQIHHLMASAANLELQRARGMAGASNNHHNASKHRANAKQKYGW